MKALLEKYDLSGSNALITGSAGLLGREHAYALLESGAHVILTDISKESLDRTMADLAHFFDRDQMSVFVMDVSQEADILNVASLLKAENRPIDILVNNAAIDPKVQGNQGVVETSRLENFSVEQWNIQLSVGITGAFLCSKIFGSDMAKRGKGGVILNIASDLAVFAPDQRLYRKEGLDDDLQPVKPVTYSVIKHALIGLTKYLSTYWPDKNIRSNALSPGGVYNGQGDEFVQKLSALIPMERMADKDEYRAAIQFLCSDASQYMNGQNIVMDGGRSAW